MELFATPRNSVTFTHTRLRRRGRRELRGDVATARTALASNFARYVRVTIRLTAAFRDGDRTRPCSEQLENDGSSLARAN